MLDDVKRFDMTKPPQRSHLRLLGALMALPDYLSHKCKITKINMKGIKPPYLLLCNHNAYMDINITNIATFPHRINYVVAIDGFIGRENTLRFVGGICKRKFTNDLLLIRQMKTVIDRGDIMQIFPEARYSLCGTNAILPESLGKLARLFKVPVVTLIMHGHHINSPYWNLTNRKVKGTEAEMKCIVTKEEIGELSVEEINRRINETFTYDEYKWQKEKGIRVAFPKRAEGLHKPLYQCPHCKKEYHMTSFGTTLKCEACGKEWEYTELGELKAKEGETYFSHIPDWYEWERENVRKEVEEGKYHFESVVRVDALPNADKFIDLGEGYLIHDENGFKLTGHYKNEHYEIEIPVLQAYGVHVEYEYLGQFGDCVDLNTKDDTLYCYPPRDSLFSVTKISLAQEELYKYYSKKNLTKK